MIRFPLLLVVLGLCLVLAPTAGAAPTAPVSFGHDDALDANPDTNIHSGFFGAFATDPNAQPDAQRDLPDNVEDNPTYEKFPVEVKPGEDNGLFRVTVQWQNPAIDLDVYVYRERPNGTLDPAPIATAATTADPEVATYIPAGGVPVPAGRYWVYVDNWCSNDADPIPQLQSPPGCGLGAVVDEDDFVGTVTLEPYAVANRLPTAVLGGPDGAQVGQAVTFSADGSSDPDGRVANVAFDLDGDGRFEYDNNANPATSLRFERPGTINVGVRVTDDRGGADYASKAVTVTGPPTPGPAKPTARPALVQRFALARPVFGGTRNRSLRISFRLSEAANVEITLLRGNRRVRRLSRADRTANRTFGLSLRSRGMRRGTYTIRLSARTRDGRTQTARLQARNL